MPAIVVSAGSNTIDAASNRLTFFVVTGNSSDVPIISLRGNNGFPPVRDFFAYQGLRDLGSGAPFPGVFVIINFETSPEGGTALDVAIYQDSIPNSTIIVYPGLE